jgi:cytochrome c oxidase assembly factor CtaG
MFAYLRGWLRLRCLAPTLIPSARLIAFVGALLLLIAALVWPLPALTRAFLIGRTAQKAALVFAAAPLLWLACSFHAVLLGLPRPLRDRLIRVGLRRSSVTPLLQAATQPAVVWFAYLSVFLAWHDSGVADLTLKSVLLRNLIPLLLLAAGLLFWQQIVATGPRRYRTASTLVRLACLLSVEAPNMAAGMYLAFHETPLYGYYLALRIAQPDFYAKSLSAEVDQGISGALIWVFGSLVYLGSVILVVNSLWRQSGYERPHPLHNWDADEKFIMPGLEERLTKR